MAQAPKVYFFVRYGLGDAIAHFFCATNYDRPNPVALILPKLKLALGNGMVSEAAAIIQSYTPATADIFRELDFPLKIVSNRGELGDGWIDVRVEPPPALDELHVDSPLPLPTRRPEVALPDTYVMLNDLASAADRCNSDWHQYFAIKRCVGLPVIKIGGSTSRALGPPADGMDVIGDGARDLSGKTTILETAWLAQHAKLIVSAITFCRCFSSLFSVPVIETCEEGRILPDTLARTHREYARKEYGINELNQWFLLPSQQAAFEEALQTHRDVAQTSSRQ